MAASGGLVLGKIACWFDFHGCYGTFTNFPTRLRVPQEVLPVHPTPLYDAAILFLLFFGLIWLSKRKKYAGQVAGVFLFISALANILVEIIRNNEAVIWKLSMAQVVYLLLLLSATIYLQKSTSTASAIHQKQPSI